jgi:transcriptional regulator with XRE-family HTH domain
MSGSASALTAPPGAGELLPDLAVLVEARMADQGWTLRDVADRAGLSIASVWALRAGARGKRPHAETLRKLALGLDLPEDVVVAAATRQEPITPTERWLLGAFRHLSEPDQAQVTRLIEDLGQAAR